MKIVRTLAIAIILTLGHGLTSAQTTARSILDQTSAKLQQAGGLEARFEATACHGTTETGTTTGTIYVSGNRFKIVAPKLTTWYDGQTQWSLNKENQEVYVSHPSAEELQSMNPYSFINLYKTGYTQSLTAMDYNGKNCHLVHLKAQKASQSINELRLIIDKTTLMPLNIRLRNNKGDWYRVRIHSVTTRAAWPAAFFTYSQAEHPDVEVIDIR